MDKKRRKLKIHISYIATQKGVELALASRRSQILHDFQRGRGGGMSTDIRVL